MRVLKFIKLIGMYDEPCPLKLTLKNVCVIIFLFTRIGHNYIPTTNIDTSIKWYTQNLGLKLINKFEYRGSYIAVLHYPHKNAIATLLIQTENNNPLEIIRNEKAFPVIALNCEDIKVLGQGEAKYFYFRDNEKNLLEATWSI
ncbi:VOC family protein [Bacillus paramycoides]|uniref:VOC family protein n=1 Tax=Bacillus paramycoides TaxID=2026194 RepID=UPI003D25482B